MKFTLAILLTSADLVSCASPGNRKPAGEQSHYLPALKPDGSKYHADDPALRTGEGGLTIQILQTMARNHEFDKLNDLFNHGVSMDSLPVGFSAGKGDAFPNVPGDVEYMLQFFIGTAWKGKFFFKSDDPKVSHGSNRIESLQASVPPHGPKPVAKFKTYLLERGERTDVFGQDLAVGATSNFVVLNYAHPVMEHSNNSFVESLLQTGNTGAIPVFDVMVAVPGKYGPIYVGKTWKGTYDLKTETFTADDPTSLIAYYFLDYNKGALDEQAANWHWVEGKEDKAAYYTKVK